MFWPNASPSGRRGHGICHLTRPTDPLAARSASKFESETSDRPTHLSPTRIVASDSGRADRPTHFWWDLGRIDPNLLRTACRAHQGWRAPGFHDKCNGVFDGNHTVIQGRTEAACTRCRRAETTWGGGRTIRSGVHAVFGRLARRRRCQWIRRRAHAFEDDQNTKGLRRGTIADD